MPKLYIRYFAKYDAYYICKDIGMVCTLLYGPFTLEEAELALPFHK